MNPIKFMLLIIPFFLTVIMKTIILIGFIRLNFGMSEELDIDLGFIVPDTSRYLNMFWDLELGKYPDQPHHSPVAVFFTAVGGTFTILWLLLLSMFSWK